MQFLMFINNSAAHYQSMLTVDFLSLLLSRYAAQGQNSMSVELKKLIPPKTLAFERIPVAVPSDEEKATLDLIAQGQRLKGMTAAAENLLSAATRLEKEVKKETTYWEQTLSVTAAGWSVCRTSRENQHQLGVQLGFAEAGPLFKAKSFVALVTRDDGSLSLDPRVATRPKMLRARVLRDGKVVGTNKPRPATIGEEETIEQRITATRDSIFEEELFHEINIEGQSLAAYGVKWRNSTVHVPIHSIAPSQANSASETEILIDLLPQSFVDESVKVSDYDDFAEHTCTFMKLLMLNTYRERLSRRSKPPPPYSDSKRQHSTASILRPLLNHDNHQTSILGLQKYIHHLRTTLSRAGVDFRPTVNTNIGLEPPGNTSNTSSIASDLVEAVAGPCLTKIVLPSPSSKGDLLLDVETRLQPQQLMREFKLQMPEVLASVIGSGEAEDAVSRSKADSKRNSLTFYSLSELISYLDFILAVDIAHHMVAATRDGWRASSQAAVVDAPGINGKPPLRITVSCGSADLTVRWKQARGESGSSRWTPQESDTETLQALLQKLASN